MVLAVNVLFAALALAAITSGRLDGARPSLKYPFYVFLNV